MGYVGGVPANIEKGGQGLGRVHANLVALTAGASNALRGATAAGDNVSSFFRGARSASGALHKQLTELANDVKYLQQASELQARKLRAAGGGD